ncbi:hypothetical protein GCM10027429_16070 [Marivirga atlantica]|jgi:PAS domain S-box-containing protein|uniref:histidine kinase n=1 Tax=Marivirga atlantica TaxID=1548457 RepID=A0A937AEW6_9BACT|nr:PAS domain S-box protein [Marivirga atlantica]MBL0765224.1 PAS domain S-box protein [Marivirga atlantica]
MGDQQPVDLGFELQQFMQLSPDMICIVSSGGYFLKVSQAVENILGYSSQDLEGKHMQEFIHPDDIEKSNREAEEIIKGKTIHDFTNRYLSKAGDIVYLNWTLKVDFANQKTYAIARDITSQTLKRQKEEIQHQINDSLINSSESLIWSVDRNLKLTGFNKAFANSIFQEYKVQVEQGQKVLDENFFPEEVIDFWKSMYQRVLAGEQIDFESHTENIDTTTKKTTWQKVFLKPIEVNGEIIGIVANSIDITSTKETAKELQERNELIEKVLAEIPMGVAVNYISTGKKLFANNQFAEVYNWPVEELEDVENFLSKIYPEDDAEAQSYKKMIIADITSGDPERMNWTNIPVRGKDNKRRFINAKNIPLFDQDLMISTAQDNTLPHLNKIKLEAAFSEKDDFIESISDSFYTLDNDYNFTHMNKHGLEIMGNSLPDLVGRNLFDVFPELKNTIFYKHLESVRKTGEPAKFEFYYEHYDLWFDERIYKTEKGFSVFFVDITITKNFLLELEKAYQKQNEILQSITDAFLALDKDFNFTYVNKEAVRIFEVETEKLIGKNLWDIFPLAHGTKVYNKFEESIRENKSNSFEYYYPPTKIWFMVNCYPSESGLSVYFRNISKNKASEFELKNLNNTLKQKNQELEQFAFVASHDLQEPLRIISSFMELLKQHYGEQLDENALKYINYAIEGSHRMKQIIIDLLEYSRAGDANAKIEKVDCSLIMDQVLGLLDDTINSKNAKISYDKLPTIDYNFTALRQVLMNLIGNGIKYTLKDQKPEIKVSHSEDEHFHRISVKDNGIGIDEAHHEQVFTIFKRLHGKTEYKGTGIGLAICKKIVEKYGGEISIDSSLGEGSTFHFTIPKVLNH